MFAIRYRREYRLNLLYRTTPDGFDDLPQMQAQPEQTQQGLAGETPPLAQGYADHSSPIPSTGIAGADETQQGRNEDFMQTNIFLKKILTTSQYLKWEEEKKAKNNQARRAKRREKSRIVGAMKRRQGVIS